MLYNVISYAFIIFGFAYIVLSTLMPRKIMFFNLKKMRITNEREYIKDKRKLFFIWGLCWVIFGILIMVNISNLKFIAPFTPLSGVILHIFEKRINNKYLVKS